MRIVRRLTLLGAAIATEFDPEAPHSGGRSRARIVDQAMGWPVVRDRDPRAVALSERLRAGGGT
jgi:hypothetical protein